MLKEALNVQCNLRTVVKSVWFEDAASGHFDLAIGAVVGTLLDPSNSFSAWYGKDGPQNSSFWDNKDFQALTPQLDREVDLAQRLPLVHQAEADRRREPAAAARRLGTDQRNLVQLRQGSQPGCLFRHLRRRAFRHGLARQELNHAKLIACRGPK